MAITKPTPGLIKDNNLSFKNIAPFLNIGQNKSSRVFSYVGLAIGVLLLFCSVQMYININRLIKDKNPRKNGFDFVSVTKTITNQNMGSDNRFTEADVQDLKLQPFIKDAAPLTSNQFRAKASAGNIIPFSTDLFLESVKDDFIDTVPPGFKWQQGQQDVPIIFSADFLEMYNVFAPAQGLPQLSESSIGAVNIVLECYGAPGIKAEFRGHIVAVSDRINSVLVPENFLLWANETFGNASDVPAARVYIKTIDANNADLLNYLQQKNYHVNKDKTKFGRVKQILQAIVSGLGAFAVLVILLAMMLFSFYLQLMIARSKDNLQLLLMLGYSPKWLSKTVAKKWIPVYAIIIIVSLAVTQMFQYIFQQNFLAGAEQLSPWLDIIVIAIAVLLMLLCIAVNYSLIKKLLYKL
ncbi:MAG: FtsX-like permease family protein [Ferruginibacter sp.]